MTENEGIIRQDLGRFGEEKAVDYLISRGYAILERNFRCRLGEIDIIAEKDGTTVFTEVKLRKNSLYGAAAEFVNSSKQRKLRCTANFYLHGKASESPCRFDVIEIYAPRGREGPVKLNHIEDAFM